MIDKGEPLGRNDTYGYALAAQPDQSQGRPTTNTGSQPTEQERPAHTCSPKAPVPDGHTVCPARRRAQRTTRGPRGISYRVQPDRVDLRTVRLRQRVTKGPGHRAAGLAMAFKLIEAAQKRWRMVNAPHLVALVRAGATFNNGKLVERPESQDQQAGGRLAA